MMVGKGDSCTPGDYAKPAVEIALLPAAAGGAATHATAWAQAHPGHTVVAVLVAGSAANECSPTDPTMLATIAASLLAGTPSIKTYAIGIFSPADGPAGPAMVDAIATAGGTGPGFNVMTSQPVEPQVLAALTSIHSTAVDCVYDIPTPMMGTFDKNLVNLQYTPGGGTGAIVPHDQDEAHCPPSGPGWYYDNDMAPKQIELCPSFCTTVSADPTGKVDILLGCPTQMGP
jgi:hypothetical protein